MLHPSLLPAQMLSAHTSQIRGTTPLKTEKMESFLSHLVPHLVHRTAIRILVLMKGRWWCKDDNELPGVYGGRLLHFGNSVGLKYLLN